MKMYRACNDGIKILGATILHFSGTSPSGASLETRQLTYITDDSDKVFLSREVCKELGMISEQFPTIGETPTTHPPAQSAITHNTTDSPIPPCKCPKRQMPPSKPTQLPYPVNEANRQHLQQWLLNYYASSMFNTREHQPLPLMDTLPMRLMVDPDATPIAHHSPIPVPLHLQDEVKAGLDRDVELGILEPVPVGKPVIWCHRMVICAKKNGKPCRTVDFQALNIHATRETHHTPSPFHQAYSVPCKTKKTVLDCWNGYHSVLSTQTIDTDNIYHSMG